MHTQDNHKLGWQLILLTILISFFTTAFTTTTSPLFAFNNSWDGNTMFTVGKGLWHGLMPYRDLFDQRGPLIYLMNSFGALVSYRSFFGVYLFEVLAVFFDIYFSYHILRLRVSRPVAYASSLILLPLVFNDYFFENGELPESLIMPMVLSLIYIVLKNNGQAPTNRQLLWQGFAMALAFWIKYSLIFPWIAFYGWIAVEAIIHLDWRELWRRVAFSLGGFCSVSLPLLLFYWLMGALNALIHVYFYINMKYYPHSKFVSIQAVKNIVAFTIRNWRTASLSALFLIGVCTFLFTRGIKWFPKLIVLTGCLFEVVMIVGNSHSYRYYYVGLGCYLILLLIGLASWFDRTPQARQRKVASLIGVVAVGAIFITNSEFTHTRLFPNNATVSTNGKSNQPFQIQFAKIINKSKDQSLLNYNNLDVGVYTAAGTLPNAKYFAKLNLKHYPPLMDSQDRILNYHQTHFVVFTLEADERIDSSTHHPRASFFQAYRRVAARNVTFQNHKMRYLLYELRS